jgi:hypothetical protein
LGDRPPPVFPAASAARPEPQLNLPTMSDIRNRMQQIASGEFSAAPRSAGSLVTLLAQAQGRGPTQIGLRPLLRNVPEAGQGSLSRAPSSGISIPRSGSNSAPTGQGSKGPTDWRKVDGSKYAIDPKSLRGIPNIGVGSGSVIEEKYKTPSLLHPTSIFASPKPVRAAPGILGEKYRALPRAIDMGSRTPAPAAIPRAVASKGPQLRPGELDPDIWWEDFPITADQRLMYQTRYGGGLEDSRWKIRWVLGKPSPKGGWIVQRAIIRRPDGTNKEWIYEAWPVPPGSRFSDDGGDEDFWHDDEFLSFGSGNQVYARARFYEGMTLPDYFKKDPRYQSVLRQTQNSPAVREFLNSQPSTPNVDRRFRF